MPSPPTRIIAFKEDFDFGTFVQSSVSLYLDYYEPGLESRIWCIALTVNEWGLKITLVLPIEFYKWVISKEV